jgi:hypothetical protein
VQPSQAASIGAKRRDSHGNLARRLPTAAFKPGEVQHKRRHPPATNTPPPGKGVKNRGKPMTIEIQASKSRIGFGSFRKKQKGLALRPIERILFN